MAYCPKCGTLLSPSDRFCPKCGTPNDGSAYGGTGCGTSGTYSPPVNDGSLDTVAMLTLLWGLLAIAIGLGLTSMVFVADIEAVMYMLVLMSGLILSGLFSLITSIKAKNRTDYNVCIWCCVLSSICAIASVICFIVGIIICFQISSKRSCFKS